MSFTGSLIIPGDLAVDGSFNVVNAVSSVGNVTTYGKTYVNSGAVSAVLTTLNGLSGAVGLTSSDGILIHVGGSLIEIDGTSIGGSYWPNGPATADMDLSGYFLTSVGNPADISGNLVVNNNIVDTAVAYEYTSNTTFQPPFVPCRLVYSIIGGGGGGGPGGQATDISDGIPCSGGGGSSGVCLTGTVILTSSAVITLSCGVGGSGGLFIPGTQDQVGSNGTATILFSSNFYDYALGGYGGGPGQHLPPANRYGGGGAGVGAAGSVYYGGSGVALASNQYRGLAAAGGGGGQGPNGLFGGGGAGYATNGITPSGARDGSPGNGEFLFARWDGAGDVGGIGGTNTPGTNYGYGGGGGGIRCVSVSTGGNGGSPAYDTGTAVVLALNGCDGVAGGGGGGGGGGYDDVGGVGRATPGAGGGRGGDGAGRFVFTSLLNPVTLPLLNVVTVSP